MSDGEVCDMEIRSYLLWKQIHLHEDLCAYLAQPYVHALVTGSCSQRSDKLDVAQPFVLY